MLAEQAKLAIVSLDRAAFRQATAAPAAAAAALERPADASVVPDTAEAGGSGGGSIGDSSSGMQLDVGSLAACADADALLCLAAVADHAAQQLAPVLAAVPRSGGGSISSEGQPRATKQRRPRQPLSVTVGQLRVVQPLYAPDRGRDMVVEVAAVHAVVGAQQGCQHSVSTAGAALNMDGTPVLRWRQLAASLRLPGPAASGSRLAAPLLAAETAAAGGVGAAPADADAGSESQEQGQPQPDVGGSPASYDAYHRARLEAWLEADAATAPSAAAAAEGGQRQTQDAAAAAALGCGPASILDARFRCAFLQFGMPPGASRGMGQQTPVPVQALPPVYSVRANSHSPPHPAPHIPLHRPGPAAARSW